MPHDPDIDSIPSTAITSKMYLRGLTTPIANPVKTCKILAVFERALKLYA